MLAQNIAPKPAALPPAAPPAAQHAGSAGGPSFEQFLTEQASPPTPAPSAEGESSDATTSQAAQAAPAASSQPAARRAPAQPAAPTKPTGQMRTPDAAARVDTPATPADRPDTAATAADEARKSDDDTDDATETPELKEFTQLIGMVAVQPDAASAPARPDVHRNRAAATGTDDAPAARARQPAVDAAGATETAPATRAAALRPDKPAAGADFEPLPVAAAHDSGDHPVAAPPQPAASSFAATLAQAQAQPLPGIAPASVGAAASTTYSGIQAPLHSAAFGPELGARVSLLAVDGVQKAELQLNPADMGPVSVQIVVDGGQAQVSFHALQAETRQALEQSLPDLAAALQGQGLTLSGGGVFQQAQQDAGRGDEGPDAGRTSSPSSRGDDRIGSATQVTATPARRTVGLLDTFA